MYPYNYKIGQKLQTDASGVNVDRAFLAHIIISAEDAAAGSAAGILQLTNLGLGAIVVNAGITNPAVPRNIQIKGNVAGINKAVTIKGTNYNGEEITEELTANGTSSVYGAKAFRTVTEVDLPSQNHVPVQQVETATVAGTVTTAGDATVTITSALLAEAEVVLVPVLLNDTANAIALAIRTALAVNENIIANFVVSGATNKVILTANEPAANDATLNIAIADGTSVGVTTAAASADTTAGVVNDAINVGWGEIFGLPYRLAHNTILKTCFNHVVEATAPAVTVDTDEIEKNTIDLNSTPDGLKQIDIYLLV
jgi:hypothetical protein